MVQKYIDLLETHFLKHENKENAYFMKKYLKNKFEFFGIKTELRRSIYKEVVNELGLPAKKDLFKIVMELWKEPQREFHHFGMELCEKYKKDIEESFIDIYEYIITHKSWWDTVDYTAIKLVGSYLQVFPDKTKKLNQKYVSSNNIWLNRTALLFQLKYKSDTNTKMLFTNIKQLSDSKEFFIQKAIGWALREYSKTDEKAVLDFATKNPLPSLSKREALRLIKS